MSNAVSSDITGIQSDHSIPDKKSSHQTIKSHHQTSLFGWLFNKHKDVVSNEKPGTVQVKSSKPTPHLELNNLSQLQTVRYHNGPIWCAKWSPCGNLLATGGHDGKVIVWAAMGSDFAHELNTRVISTMYSYQDYDSSHYGNGGDSTASSISQWSDHSSSAFAQQFMNEYHAMEEATNDNIMARKGGTQYTTATDPLSLDPQHLLSSLLSLGVDPLHGRPILHPLPYRIYVAHRADVVDLAWSQNNFLVSVSLDNYAYIWHLTPQDKTSLPSNTSSSSHRQSSRVSSSMVPPQQSHTTSSRRSSATVPHPHLDDNTDDDSTFHSAISSSDFSSCYSQSYSGSCTDSGSYSGSYSSDYSDDDDDDNYQHDRYTRARPRQELHKVSQRTSRRQTTASQAPPQHRLQRQLEPTASRSHSTNPGLRHSQQKIPPSASASSSRPTSASVQPKHRTTTTTNNPETALSPLDTNSVHITSSSRSYGGSSDNSSSNTRHGKGPASVSLPPLLNLHRLPLCSFEHTDVISAVCFHPLVDRFLLTTTIDGVIRIWDMVLSRVVAWSNTPDIITTAVFSPNGLHICIGLYSGQIAIYSANTLVHLTTVNVRNRSGTQKQGRKVSGLDYSYDSRYLLVTTADSRLRLLAVTLNYTMITKFKGHVHSNLLLKAKFSPGSAQQIIIGSEDGACYLYKRDPAVEQEQMTLYLTQAKEKEALIISSHHSSTINDDTLSPSQDRESKHGNMIQLDESKENRNSGGSNSSSIVTPNAQSGRITTSVVGNNSTTTNSTSLTATNAIIAQSTAATAAVRKTLARSSHLSNYESFVVMQPLNKKFCDTQSNGQQTTLYPKMQTVTGYAHQNNTTNTTIRPSPGPTSTTLTLPSSYDTTNSEQSRYSPTGKDKKGFFSRLFSKSSGTHNKMTGTTTTISPSIVDTPEYDKNTGTLQRVPESNHTAPVSSPTIITSSSAIPSSSSTVVSQQQPPTVEEIHNVLASQLASQQVTNTDSFYNNSSKDCAVTVADFVSLPTALMSGATLSIMTHLIMTCDTQGAIRFYENTHQTN